MGAVVGGRETGFCQVRGTVQHALGPGSCPVSLPEPPPKKKERKFEQAEARGI